MAEIHEHPSAEFSTAEFMIPSSSPTKDILLELCGMYLILIPIPISVGWEFCFRIKLYRHRGRSSVASNSDFSTKNHSPGLDFAQTEN